MLEIQRDRAKNAWDHATRNASKMRITAPLDGLVVLKSIWKQGTMGEVQEGEEVRAGIPILEVVDPTTMRVRANVNQADAVHLTPGAPVRVTLDSYPARTFAGKVEYVSPGGHHQLDVAARAHVPRGVLGGGHRRAPAAGPGRRDRRDGPGRQRVRR